MNKDHLVLDKDDMDERVLKLITSIGYTHRVSNCYCIREIDGYINIHSYSDINRKEVIEFHKNINREYIHPHNKDLHIEFHSYKEFEKFIESYHQQICRKLKLKKLNII